MEEKLFSKKDLEAAYNAGVKSEGYFWHMEEFHGASCKCTPIEYNDFNSWFNINY